MHFLLVFKLLFEERGGEIFGDPYLPSGDQKFDRQLAPVLNSKFRTLTGQVRNQAGHCPLTGRYFQP